MKKYKSINGNEVRILAEDLLEPYPVVIVENLPSGQQKIDLLTSDYRCSTNTDTKYIHEYNPYEGIEIGDPVYVWHSGIKYRGYFAGLDSTTGKPMIFYGGKTEWSSDGITSSWDYCEKVNEQVDKHPLDTKAMYNKFYNALIKIPDLTPMQIAKTLIAYGNVFDIGD